MFSLEASGYVLQIVGFLEIVIGLMLLINKAVPFALLLLAPISVNILLFHLFLDLPGIAGAIVIANGNLQVVCSFFVKHTCFCAPFEQRLNIGVWTFFQKN